MTALTQYQRLECPAQWREHPEAEPRLVVLSLGDATVVISDFRSSRALSHWSLPAVVRLNPGKMPALYGPGDDAAETLEVEEDTMIEALDKVRTIIAARRPSEGRLRGTLVAGVAICALLAAVTWLPGAMMRHTAVVLPFSKRQAIGEDLLADVAPLTGPACSNELGRQALAHLTLRLFGTDSGARLLVVRKGVKGAVHLPGRIVLVDRDLVEREDSPDVVAGAILAEKVRAEAHDPISEVLSYAGLSATFRLLTTGNLPRGAITGYGAQILAAPAETLDDTALLAAFAGAGVAATPYALATDPTGERTRALIESDPAKTGTGNASPVLTDEDWVALQGICS